MGVLHLPAELGSRPASADLLDRRRQGRQRVILLLNLPGPRASRASADRSCPYARAFLYCDMQGDDSAR